jgi:hypothetical protein
MKAKLWNSTGTVGLNIYSLKLTVLCSPGSLINNEGSRFHKLCKAAGIEEFSKLKAMAQ